MIPCRQFIKDDTPASPRRIGELCALTVCAGHRLGDVERQLAVETLDALCPIEVGIADAALKSAVVLLGHGLHASQYLNALREHVLLARKKGHP